MKDSIKILFAGDFIPPEIDDNIFSEDLLNVLQAKDFSIVNLETPLTCANTKIEKTGNSFKRHPSAIRHVKDGYFDAVALSNNHIRDYGDKGVYDTIEACKQYGISTIGAGLDIEEAAKPLRICIKGRRISILNYSEQEFNIASKNGAGANPFDLIDAVYQIETEKTENDFVIVIYHGGLEYQYFPTLGMVKNFKFMIDIGADTIVAHHTHKYSGTIIYKEKPIIFGLGNFLCSTVRKISDEWQIGIIAEITLAADKIDFKVVPVKMSEDFNKINLMIPKEAQKVLNHIEEISFLIEEPNLFHNYWLSENLKDSEKILRLLKSNSKLEYRLRKYFPLVFNNHLTNYRKNMMLNMIRCVSQRERLIRILEEYK